MGLWASPPRRGEGDWRRGDGVTRITVVLCNNTLVGQWVDEARKFSPALEVVRGLCDAVPAVPTHVALETVREDLGDVVIEGLDVSAVPVAAASLGQVYRARFEGRDVAVKVQRPNMACGVARDLYLLGNWARFVESVKKILIPKQRPYDIQLIDAFCRGAYGELDYEHEAANQRRFKDAIANGPASLRDVYVPEVRLATRRVLISDWVEGERLSQASVSYTHLTLPTILLV